MSTSAINLYQEITARGVRLAANGDRLTVDAPKEVLTPDLLDSLKAHKTELLAYLANGSGELSTADAAGLRHMIEVREMRERGIAPRHYVAQTVCRHCGPVPIFPGAPARVEGCPWCLNRAAGRPIPRPPHDTP